MKITRIAALACLCGFAAMAPNMNAALGDKKTFFTFSGPVEIPGQVLPAGTYVFKLLDSTSATNVVRVFNNDETRLIGTFLTIFDYRMQVPEEPLVRFTERPAGSPPAIKSWFYPGNNYGNEFVYPKARAIELAKDSKVNVPAMPSELAANITLATNDQNDPKLQQMKESALKAEEPSGEEVEVAAVFLIAAPIPAVPAFTQSDSTDKLPQTGSPLPLFAGIGLISLAVGLAIRGCSQRLS